MALVPKRNAIVGDTVQLIGGSDPMTIAKILDPQHVQCIWFPIDGIENGSISWGSFQQANFPVVSLRQITQEDIKNIHQERIDHSNSLLGISLTAVKSSIKKA